MKAHKITNPLAVGQIAPLIMKFYNGVKESSGIYEGITYESLCTQITGIVQFNTGELWVAFDGNTPVGFAVFTVLGLPFIGTVFCPCMYNDTRNQKAIKELYDEFFQFGLRNRALLYKYYAVNEKVGEYFKVVADKIGVVFNDTGAREYIGRKK